MAVDNRNISTAQLVRNYLSDLSVGDVITTRGISKAIRRPIKEIHAEISRQKYHKTLAPLDEFEKGFRKFESQSAPYFPKTVANRPRPRKATVPSRSAPAPPLPPGGYSEAVQSVIDMLHAAADRLASIAAPEASQIPDEELLREVSRRLTS